MKRDNAHDPRAIANKILEICESAGKPVTIMKLIKLVYLADGWSMALRDRPLSSEAPQAWQYGPVFPTVYQAFKQFGSSRITAPAKQPFSDIPIEEDFSTDELALMKQVVNSYGKFHAFQLSEIMHREGTPWSETFNTRGRYAEIPVETISEHFKGIRKKRQVAAAT